MADDVLTQVEETVNEFRQLGKQEVSKHIPVLRRLPKNPTKAKARIFEALSSLEARGQTHPNVAVPTSQLDLDAAEFKRTRLALPFKHEGWFPETWRSGELHAHQIPGYYLIHRDAYGMDNPLKHARHDLLPALKQRLTGKQPELVKRAKVEQIPEPAQAKKVLQPGDIIVTTQKHPPLWHAPLARFSKVWQGTEYDHSSIYLGNGRVGNMGLKFKSVPLKEFHDEYDYQVYRVKAPKQERQAAAEWAKKQVGNKSFSFSGILRQLVPSTLEMPPEEAQKRDSMICSAIVAAAYPKRRFGGRPALAVRPLDFQVDEQTKLVAKTAEAAAGAIAKIPMGKLREIVEQNKETIKSSEKRPELQPGDILLSRLSTKRYPIAGRLAPIIGVLQGSHVQHAAIYAGNGEVVHAWPGKGVVSLSLKDFKDRNYTEVYRVQVPKKERLEAAAFARKAVGRGYSYTDLIRAAVPGMTNKEVDKLTARDKSDFICSGLVAAAYPKREFGGRSPSVVRPVDFERSPLTKKIAGVYMKKYVGAHVRVPTDMTTHVSPEAAKYRAEKFGRVHHVTLLTPKEVERLKKKGYSPSYIKQVFDSVPLETMTIKREPMVFDTPHRTYDVLPVSWPEAQMAREQLGLRPARLHVTVGATEKGVDG